MAAITNSLNNNNSLIGETLDLNIDAWQLAFRDDLTWFVSNKHKIKTGIQLQYGKYDFNGNLPLNPLESDLNDTTKVLRTYDVHTKGNSLNGGYLLYDGNPINALGINFGVRFDHNPGRKYVDISPRFGLNYQLTDKSKFRLSTGVFNQFPDGNDQAELISNRAIHYITGFEYKFTDTFYGWVEGYIKDYQNLVHYDANLVYTNDGEGIAQGIELFLRKEKGDLRGWVSYALSKSERIPMLTDEVTFFEFDQRHVFNIVGEYSIKQSKDMWFIPSLLQTSIRYTDGTPYTPVLGAANDGSGWQAISGPVLSARNSDYTNVNFRIEWTFPMGKKAIGTSYFEVWNLLNSKNILGRAYQYGPEYPNNINEQKYYATPLLPGGGFRVNFL